MMAPQTLVTTYLEMQSPAEFKAAYSDLPDVRVLPMSTPDVEFYLFLYKSVGYQWGWRDRLLIPTEEMRRILDDENRPVYVMYRGAVPAGYIELFRESQNIEVAYFGLRTPFLGMGLGKHLLSFGITRAWEMPDAARVWVHTCNLDGPAALPNYQARGFKVYEIHEEPMPERYINP